MKRLSIFPRQPDVVDVHDVRDIVRHPWFKSPRLWVLLAATLVAIAVVLWWAYAAYLKPIRDQRFVDEAVTLLEANSSMAGISQRLADWPSERSLMQLSHLFRAKELITPHELGLKASRSALDLAIHRGSREARLELV